MKSIILRDHEVRRLGTHGSVLVVRAVKPQPQPAFTDGRLAMLWKESRGRPGEPGEERWVRETWAHDGPDLDTVRTRHEDVMGNLGVGYGPYYRADGVHSEGGLRWRTPVTMPRWVSRYTVRCADVRVGRVQEIEVDEERAAGINVDGGEAFDMIFDRYGGSFWGQNPWVWMAMFERVDG